MRTTSRSSAAGTSRARRSTSTISSSSAAACSRAAARPSAASTGLRNRCSPYERIESSRTAFRSAEDFKRFGERLSEAWNVNGQSVVGGGEGVHPASRLGNVCIFTDYLMKATAQGREKMPGVASMIERNLARPAGARAGGSNMARFWFRVAEDQPRFLTDGSVIAIEAADMIVLTEAQVSTRDGRLIDASDGSIDPIMSGLR